MEKICFYCNSEYYALSSSQMCCSRVCLNALRKKHPEYSANYQGGKKTITRCTVCGNEFESWIYQKRLYCSHECHHKGMSMRRGSDSHNWNGGISKNEGYARFSGDKYVHRQIWEDMYGPLPEGFILHHEDGDKNNNDIKNLQLVTRSEHAQVHNNNIYGIIK